MAREYVIEPFRAPAQLQIDYGRELNPQQLAAVSAPLGPALVLAGAGAGKTRTLIYRVAWLLEHGVQSGHILLLTFTNKAAREMMRRVGDLLGGDLGELWGGTFHAVANRLLRRHAPRLGYGKDFTVLDREDAEQLIKACLGESKVDPKDTRVPKPGVLAEIISLATNTRQEIAEIVAQQFESFALLAPTIAELAVAYQNRKRAANVMDFDDLLVNWLRLLQEHEEVRAECSRRFRFVLVDEYQDTNKIQAEIVDLMAAAHRNLMVVGDDSQSIYSWRGANFRNILEFPKRYPDARIFKIETNYRSTPEILQLANASIRANIHQFHKELVAARSAGPKPVLTSCLDAHQQAAFVAQRLLQLREEGTDLQHMAVLYRSHFHALELQLELTRRNIPFTITSGIRVFEQAHIKDVAAYLKLVCNPRDELAFKRIVLLLPGIGPRAAQKLWAAYYTALGSGAAQEARGEPPGQQQNAAPIATTLQQCRAQVPPKAAVPWAALVATMSQLEPEQLRGLPGRMIRLVVEAGYEDYLKTQYSNYRARLEDLTGLAEFAAQFQSLEEFLTQLSLLSNIEAEEENQAGQQDDEKVRLSTIHQAKGLEFDVVFVIMLSQGLFPSARSVKSANEEEERRLFYVALTRARNELYLCCPLTRSLGGGSSGILQPSMFVQELPRDYVDEWNLRGY